MDFKQIEAFANVVKYKSFSKAGDACFLTQPTISAHISTLEKELGVKLIERSSKEVRPTKQGQLFFCYATDMLNTREKAVQNLIGDGAGIEGVLEIQASTIPGQYILPKLLCGFSVKYPKVKFYLEQSDSQNVIDNLKDGKGEIGFTGDKGRNKLEFIPLKQDEVVLITPDNIKFRSLLKKGKTIEIENFIKEPFLFREKGSGTRKEFEEKIEKLGYPYGSLNEIARINNMETIKQAVISGLGVSIVSEIATEVATEDKLSTPGYLTFHIEGFQSDRQFYMVTNPKITMSPVAEAFVKFVNQSK